MTIKCDWCYRYDAAMDDGHPNPEGAREWMESCGHYPGCPHQPMEIPADREALIEDAINTDDGACSTGAANSGPSDWAMERAGDVWHNMFWMREPDEATPVIAAALDTIWQERGGEELVKRRREYDEAVAKWAAALDEHNMEMKASRTLAEQVVKQMGYCSCAYATRPTASKCLYCMAKAALAKAKPASGTIKTCEGCDKPATTSDREGVPLCDDCFASLEPADPDEDEL